MLEKKKKPFFTLIYFNFITNFNFIAITLLYSLYRFFYCILYCIIQIDTTFISKFIFHFFYLLLLETKEKGHDGVLHNAFLVWLKLFCQAISVKIPSRTEFVILFNFFLVIKFRLV